jgi:mannose-6-phosphate isomerase-like protein (cupin superfamily)
VTDPDHDYKINLDDKYGALTLVDIPGEIAACTEQWFNQTLTTVNDAVIRLGIVEGEFHWHHHDLEDEFFLVLEGELLIDVEGGGTVALKPHEGFTVPRGVVHRTRAPQRTVILMVEGGNVKPTGDAAG